MPEPGPGGKSHADGRLGVMDPAVDQSILPPLEERARETFFFVRINPVIDMADPGKVIQDKTCGSVISPV
jgi:hypothetical protein